MKALLIRRYKVLLDDRSMVEWVIWKVPSPVEPSQHQYKYRLVYLVDGIRVVGFDNERGKGDHKHIGTTELPYDFSSVEKLRADFLQEVEAWNAR